MTRQGLIWALVLSAFAARSLSAAEPRSIICEGSYPHHLQGVCVDKKSIYWSFTTTLVKTDLNGKLLKKIPVANHHGDLCFHKGRLYVAVNLGQFNNPQGKADSWVYVYEARDLSFVARHAVPQVFYGAGGMGVRSGHFFVVGGLPGDIQENYVYEYDAGFKFLKRHVLKSGQTLLGIQTATFAHDRWWFGCYGNPSILLVADANLQSVKRYEFECALGIEASEGGRLLVARGGRAKDKKLTGQLVVAEPHEKQGLKLVENKPSR